MWLWTVAVLAALAGVTGAQEQERSSPFFDCPYINYFDEGCPELEKEQARVEPPAEGEQKGSVAADERDTEQDWLQEVPEHLLPLFPKESLAPDTPVLYQLLLMRPTLSNARRYVRWHSRRMSRIKEAQDLIAVAGREFLAQRATGE